MNNAPIVDSWDTFGAIITVIDTDKDDTCVLTCKSERMSSDDAASCFMAMVEQVSSPVDLGTPTKDEMAEAVLSTITDLMDETYSDGADVSKMPGVSEFAHLIASLIESDYWIALDDRRDGGDAMVDKPTIVAVTEKEFHIGQAAAQNYTDEEMAEAQRRLDASDHLCNSCHQVGRECYCGGVFEFELACIRDPEFRETVERYRARQRARAEPDCLDPVTKQPPISTRINPQHEDIL